MTRPRLTGIALIVLFLTSAASAQSPSRTTDDADSESKDPTVASPLIQQLLQNLLQPTANATRSAPTTAASRGPRFRLSGLVLTSPTSGVAVITTQTGAIRLTLKKSGDTGKTHVPAQRFNARPGDTASEATTAPKAQPGRPDDKGVRPEAAGEQPKGATEIDLSTSFSDGDSLFRIIDFRRGMILLEELPAGRLLIVR